MQVIPYQSDRFQGCEEIYQFLVSCQQKSIRDGKPKIASISLAIESVDPLVVLHEIAQPDQLHFYFENRHKAEAVLAIGTTVCHTSEGPKRFRQAQTFINSHLRHVLPVGSRDLPFFGPHFFCSFTFFDQNRQRDFFFPPCTLFLPQWQISRSKNRYSLVANLSINDYTDVRYLSKVTWHQWQKINSLHHVTLEPPLQSRSRYNQKNVISTSDFRTAVTSTLKAIQAHQLHKVVLAHAIDVSAEQPLLLAHSLQNLRRLHPDCYTFSTSNGRGKSFIGASPERLISIDDGKLITDALAGSA
ncbi:MAG: isochorismate synthase, partial [Cyanothece sp. SIO1E1]|nr:isochorismate synthase [Cyanothece sp. SIO1E1]